MGKGGMQTLQEYHIEVKDYMHIKNKKKRQCSCNFKLHLPIRQLLKFGFMIKILAQELCITLDEQLIKDIYHNIYKLTLVKFL